MQVQLQLFSVFATDLATGTGCAAHLRHDVGVSRLMYMHEEYNEGKACLFTENLSKCFDYVYMYSAFC